MPTTTKTKKQAGATDSKLGAYYVTKRSPDTIFTRGYWHKYESGVWSQIPDSYVRVDVWELLEEYEKHGLVKPTASKHKSVLTYVQDHLNVPEDRLDTHAHLINLTNGVYNLESGQLIPHDPLLLLTSQLPFEYDPVAQCPWWNHYIQTTFVDNAGRTDDNLLRLVQEAVAYSLTTDVSYQQMFWCVGEGENGKGVLFHILNTLGGNSATPLDLNSLRGSARYELATLANKRIALCSESSATNNLLEDATIKALVSGDHMQVRQIRREPFILEPKVKLWWAMNRLPAVADTSHGMWRRIVMLPFNRTFDDKTRIRDLKERLDRELPGIFNWCLEGYARLKAQAHFSYCGQSEELKKNFQHESNTLRLFVEDCCEVDTPGTLPPGEAGSKELFDLYKVWARIMNYKPMSSRSFKQEMEALKYFYVRDSSSRKFTGLKIDEKKAKDGGFLSDGPWQPPLR
jgi:putative DNA primase/helicase